MLDKRTRSEIEKNKQKYLNLLKDISKTSYNIIQKKLEEALLTKTSIIRKIIMVISFISGYKIILNSIVDSSFPLSGILLIINSILLFKSIFRKICKGKIESALLLSALLYIILRFIF